MSKSYFHKVQNETPTRFWVNNPTPQEAAQAISAGAESCTTNPTYAIKMLNHTEMQIEGLKILKKVIIEEQDNSLAASKIQALLVKKIMDIFYQVYTHSGGTKGWVSIQGDPEKEEDSSEILKEAEANLKLHKNYIAKIPVTDSGLAAISELSAGGIPVIATEGMSLSQAIHACETYVKAISGLTKPAPIYITHITGIYDQCLREWKKQSNADIADETLFYAGILVARKLYRVVKERKYPVTILGGGARGLHHFTEFVGADMHITINWKGTADRLIKENSPVIDRFSKPISAEILEELLEKVPLFKTSWYDDGLSVKEYSDYPPVVLFRNMFLDGWRKLKAKIGDIRNEN